MGLARWISWRTKQIELNHSDTHTHEKRLFTRYRDIRHPLTSPPPLSFWAIKAKYRCALYLFIIYTFRTAHAQYTRRSYQDHVEPRQQKIKSRCNRRWKNSRFASIRAWCLCMFHMKLFMDRVNHRSTWARKLLTWAGILSEYGRIRTDIVTMIRWTWSDKPTRWKFIDFHSYVTDTICHM